MSRKQKHNTMSENAAIAPGGWSAFTNKIDAQAEKAFQEATHGLVGVRYTPFAVSQQVVAGMNYIFLCNGQASTMPPMTGLYSVHVFKPLNGNAVVTRIVHIAAY
jgi:hypothetical protein